MSIYDYNYDGTEIRRWQFALLDEEGKNRNLTSILANLCAECERRGVELPEDAAAWHSEHGRVVAEEERRVAELDRQETVKRNALAKLNEEERSLLNIGG